MVLRIIWIFFYLFIQTYALPPEVAPKFRIYDGNSAKPGQFPFMAGIFANEKFVCGGTIIGIKWVLTAAHCVEAYFVKYFILVGSTKLSSGIRYKISSIILHQWYLMPLNDIALIKTDGEFKLNRNVKAIELGGTSYNAVGTVVGWGITEALRMPKDLLFVEILILPAAKCELKQYLCIRSKGTEGPCFGDSGGPLVEGGKLVGVVSHLLIKKGCGKGAVFMNVAYYKNWIVSTMENEPSDMRVLLYDVLNFPKLLFRKFWVKMKRFLELLLEIIIILL